MSCGNIIFSGPPLPKPPGTGAARKLLPALSNTRAHANTHTHTHRCFVWCLPAGDTAYPTESQTGAILGDSVITRAASASPWAGENPAWHDPTGHTKCRDLPMKFWKRYVNQSSWKLWPQPSHHFSVGRRIYRRRRKRLLHGKRNSLASSGSYVARSASCAQHYKRQGVNRCPQRSRPWWTSNNPPIARPSLGG